MWLLVCVAVATELTDYHRVMQARPNHAIVLLTQEDCVRCRALERDLLPALQQADFLYDSRLVFVSAEREPELNRRLMRSQRGLPQLLVFRVKNERRHGWRHIGYQSQTELVEWLNGIRRWREPRKQ